MAQKLFSVITSFAATRVLLSAASAQTRKAATGGVDVRSREGADLIR